MKNLVLIFLLAIIANTSVAQWLWNIDFENPQYLNRVYRDTVSNPNCIWQIGQPIKAIFTGAHSVPNAIVTDTLYPAPANDTSIFYLKHVRNQLQPWHWFTLNFYYQMNGDSMDIGKIEISPDTGHTWINIMTEDTIYNIQWLMTKPTLTGNTSGWQFFSINMEQWASYPAMGGGPYPILITADTVLFRFTYISDSSSTPHDGWMIDDFTLEDWYEGIPEIQNSNSVMLSPNPFNNQTTLNLQSIKNENQKSLLIYNVLGQEVRNIFVGTSTSITINRNNLPSGMYFYKLMDDGPTVLGMGKMMME
ncbi:MAG: T9SS type A sorting domain-containing protein [Bacteroidota bacterium]